MYLFQRIEEVVVQYSDARRLIGEFLLENRDQISKYNMDDIAKLTFTSKPTLVRFAKNLGYSGWKEFMYAFAHETVIHKDDDNDMNPNFPFQATDDTLEIIESLSNLQIQSIKDTVSLMSAEDINQAANLINQAETIIIYGVSPNSYYGELFKRKLLTIRKKAIMSPLGESGLISKTLTKNDCAIIISYSGNNPDRNPTSNIRSLLKNKVPIIGITSGGHNYLRDYSNVILNISSKERLYSKITNFASEQSIMFILNILYAKVFALEYEKNKEFKILNSKVLESEREATFKDLIE
ncbi:MurR/RpiR family transcriptional regulator [Oceanobacillus oncorhynchi subsp. oncorhynchi]|uniref:MurR/RpiR family transcriptional regulator n=1 Tax=Oceanobacillus oncorhynchi TaxID=545501 RepID=UPI0031D9A3A3